MENNNLTPLMKEYIDIKKKYQNCILLARVGDFYEMFYDDAKIASQILNITLTKRGKGEKEAPLAGIPYHSIDPYIAKLVKHGKKVVIYEQVEDPKLAKGLVKRKVTRIITPSTLFSENYENNFLCSISKIKETYGFAIIDITTNDFHIDIFENLNELLDELYLIKPKELLITKNILNNEYLIEQIKKVNLNTIINYADNIDINEAYNDLKKHFQINNLSPFGLENKDASVLAANNALIYLKETQFSKLEYIKNIKEYVSKKYLKIDRNTLRNLEIVSNLQDNTIKNSLFDLINSTKTAMGYRKLYFDIQHPLLDVNHINKIYECIDELKNNIFIQEEIKKNLLYIGDLDKLISKIGFGNANPRDLIVLKRSLNTIPLIKQSLCDLSSELFLEINKNLSPIKDVYDILEKAIVEEPPFSIREGGFIKHDYCEEMFNIINANKTFKSWLTNYEQTLKNETNIKNLKIKFNKIFGYYIEISKTQSKEVPEYFIRKQTLVNCERYTTNELSEKETHILNLKSEKIELETKLFYEVCKKVLKYQKEIKEISKQIGVLDVYLSHTITSCNNNYNKPKINYSGKCYFENLRHPIVERFTDYIPNYCDLNKDNRTMIITGPNMAGKSCYMRSICLSQILGQIGCFVPAKNIDIQIISSIFSRVGATDNILHGQSTFLVEMSEVAYILNNVNENSLVILDEIGRGTSTYDGISLAWAIVEYLNNNVKCKTLLATHYHILNKMEEIYEGINNFHVTAKEEGDEMHFYHKLQKGGINKSYGIQVAKISGVNKQVINRALQIQTDLENDSFLKTPGKIIKSTLQNNTTDTQTNTTKIYKKEQKNIFDY